MVVSPVLKNQQFIINKVLYRGTHKIKLHFDWLIKNTLTCVPEQLHVLLLLSSEFSKEEFSVHGDFIVTGTIEKHEN